MHTHYLYFGTAQLPRKRQEDNPTVNLKTVGCEVWTGMEVVVDLQSLMYAAWNHRVLTTYTYVYPNIILLSNTSNL
jgi:hypothetical protein